MITEIKPELRVGVVGYGPPIRFDEHRAQRMILNAYSFIKSEYPERKIVVVSGLQNDGVSKIAYDEAVNCHWYTVGIACRKVMSRRLYPVNETIIVGETWGDESKTFVQYVNFIVRIGDTKQLMRTAMAVKTRGHGALEFELPELL